MGPPQKASPSAKPAYAEMLKQAAQGELFHSDDTTAKVLSLMKEGATENGRKGIFTTGILSKMEDRMAVLYFTGRNHAGENNVDAVLTVAWHYRPPPEKNNFFSSRRAYRKDTDNGTQYVSEKHNQLLKAHEIISHNIPACTPQYNGSVEYGGKELKNIFYNVWEQRQTNDKELLTKLAFFGMRPLRRIAKINQEVWGN